MVSQFEPKVELHRRGPDRNWIRHEWTGLDAVAALESVFALLPLWRIYAKIEFEMETRLAMAATQLPFATLDEYFAIEEASAIRHEYYRGRILAMAGGTYGHALIITNASGELRALLKGRTCDVIANELRLAADPDAHYTYPDVLVICGEPVFQGGRKHTVMNPVVIIEVLSPSTEAVDRGRKFADYRKLPTLMEYVMISQHEPRVEVYRLGLAGQWTLFEYIGLDIAVQFESLGVELPMSEIYQRVSFELASTEPEGT